MPTRENASHKLAASSARSIFPLAASFSASRPLVAQPCPRAARSTPLSYRRPRTSALRALRHDFPPPDLRCQAARVRLVNRVSRRDVIAKETNSETNNRRRKRDYADNEICVTTEASTLELIQRKIRLMLFKWTRLASLNIIHEFLCNFFFFFRNLVA